MKLVYLKTLGGISMMLMTIIYYSLVVVEIIVAVIGLRKIIPMKNKDDYDNAKNIKVRLIFFCILMALIVFELIPRLTLGKSIISNILIIIYLGVCIGMNLYTRNKKIKEESTNK